MGQTAATFTREFGRQFANTAKKELIEQFTFKGFKNASFFCKVMRGAGIGGAYYEQYQIWSSDKDTLEKLKESSIGLMMSIFAAKGATYVCFPAGTKVHTLNGLQNIEAVQVGDWVLTYDEQTHEQAYKPVLVKHERYTHQMMALELPTGEFLEVTPEHRFYHNGEWIEARSLKAGDLLHLKNGDYTTIISIENFPKYQKVYNFDIADNENYYVAEDGILVHNGYKEAVDDVNDLTPGSKGGWNKALNGELKPNSKYKVGDYLYETDDLGRVSRVSGNLELGKLGRNNYQQGKSVRIKDGIIGEDQGGHLIAHQFKGAGEQINYLPQKGTLNNGAWKDMEKKWADALKENPPKKVEVEITPIYEGVSKRPDKFKVIYKIGEEEFVKTFPN